MPESMRLRLDRNDRELRLARLREKLGIEKERWKADVIDAALINLDETIDNHESFEGDPTVAKEFNTKIVRSHYRTNVETRLP